MKKSGYDQFFSDVRQQSKKNPSSPPPLKTKVRARKRAKAPNWILVTIAVFGLAGSITLFLNPNLLQTIGSSVEVKMFGEASASESAKMATPPSPQPAKTTDAKTDADSNLTNPVTELTPEEISIFSKLNERKHQLDLREAELNKLEAELQQQQVKLDEKIQKLEAIRTQIAQTLKGRVETDDKKIDTLVEFYSNMQPKEAAKIIDSLDEDLAVETLSRMKKKNAAQIMNLLDSKKAESLSEKIAGFKR